MIWVHYTTWGLWHNWGEMLRKLTSRLEQVAWSDVCAGEYWVCIILRWARLSWSLETVSFKTDEMLVSALNLWPSYGGVSGWQMPSCYGLGSSWQDIADGTLMLRGCEGNELYVSFELWNIVCGVDHRTWNKMVLLCWGGQEGMGQMRCMWAWGCLWCPSQNTE